MKYQFNPLWSLTIEWHLILLKEKKFLGLSYQKENVIDCPTMTAIIAKIKL
jgi:hypothetical protein